MLGTSTASGNVSEEGKIWVIFTSVLHYFLRWRKLVAIVQGTRENPYFPRLTLLLPSSYQTTAPTFHSKVLVLLKFV